MRFRPVSPPTLVDEVSALVADRPDLTRVIIDGAPPTRPDVLADDLGERLRLLGRPVLRISAADFLRAASLRFERGRTDPDARYDDWLDAGALRREVLDPMGPDGSRRVLPRLWNAETDRAARADYVDHRDGVVLVDGELLLGRGLPHDYSVHLWLSTPALARKLPESEHWALSAFARYDAEVRPLYVADTGVRADDPLRLAVLDDAPV
ncbi:uridine kinase [Actinokineospora sp. HBU206404]|uniref:Uridine kinase n=1 Tax=Actinokineospora xionganensis TaxID=2684470 RepID=A0ABR7L4V6_9PSEU|nr:uridine kinase [Actinokineospora xionganensis]MBC6447722.1 uridine kinase [Actinokineospora xionganensis]